MTTMTDDVAGPDGSALSEGLDAWMPAHERVPAIGTEYVALVIVLCLHRLGVL